MKSLQEYINIEDNRKTHLRNIFIEVDEELKNIETTKHSRERKDQSHNQTEDISLKEVRELIEQCDDKLVNIFLNTNIPTIVGIKKTMPPPLKYFIIVFEVIKFDKNTFEYDVKLITHDKYNMNKKDFVFSENTNIVLEVNGKYVKQTK